MASTLHLVLASIPIIAAIIAFINFRQAYSIVNDGVIEENLWFVLWALGCFAIAYALHLFVDITGLESLELVFKAFEVFGFSLLLISSHVAKGVRQVYDTDLSSHMPLFFAFTVAQAPLVQEGAALTAEVISLVIALFACYVAYRVQAMMSDSRIKRMYLTGFYFRVILTFSPLLFLIEGLTEIEAFEIAAYVFASAAFLLMAVDGHYVKSLSIEIREKYDILKKQYIY